MEMASAVNGATTNSNSMLVLAESILRQVKDVQAYYEANSLTPPDLSLPAVEPPRTKEYLMLYGALSAELEDLQCLIAGPTGFWRHYFARGWELGAMQVALDFEFFSNVPVEGELSYEDFSQRVGLDVDRTRRIVRLLITQRVFEERTPGFISHNSLSAALQDEELRSVVHFSLDEVLKAASEMGHAFKQSPDSSNISTCAFAARHGTSIFDYYAQNPQKAARFAKGMAGHRKIEDNVAELRDDGVWKNLMGTVVDIGGGSGHVSIILSEAYPHLTFEVQDISKAMLEQGEALLTDNNKDRISFREADFFQPQPTHAAAAYLLRQCTHNWTDDYVVDMLKSLVSALEGSPVDTPLLINDIVLPDADSSMSRTQERHIRQTDMAMLINFGARQRTKAEFESLLKQADPRFNVARVSNEGSLGLLEVYLEREKQRQDSVYG